MITIIKIRHKIRHGGSLRVLSRVLSRVLIVPFINGILIGS